MLRNMPRSSTLTRDVESRTIQQLVQQGIGLYDKGRYDEAIQQFQRALALDPNSGLANYELSLTYDARGDQRRCISTASSARERRLTPDQYIESYIEGLYTLKASCHSKSDQPDRALATFRSGLERFPNSYSLHLNAAVTLRNTGQSNQARDHLGEAIRSAPQQSSPYFMLGEILRQDRASPHTMLSYLSFLLHESGTRRSKIAAARLVNLMHAPREGDPAPVVVVGMDDKLTAGNQGLRLARVTARLTREADGELTEPMADNIANGLNIFIRFAEANVEFDAKVMPAAIAPLLANLSRIVDAGAAEALGYFAAAEAGVPGARDWLDDNLEQSDALYRLMPNRR
ncbi:MAG: tetratricopeptide repeat protein [Pseudomonadota bacterium]